MMSVGTWIEDTHTADEDTDTPHWLISLPKRILYPTSLTSSRNIHHHKGFSDLVTQNTRTNSLVS